MITILLIGCILGGLLCVGGFFLQRPAWLSVCLLSVGGLLLVAPIFVWLYVLWSLSTL